MSELSPEQIPPLETSTSWGESSPFASAPELAVEPIVEPVAESVREPAAADEVAPPTEDELAAEAQASADVVVTPEIPADDLAGAPEVTEEQVDAVLEQIPVLKELIEDASPVVDPEPSHSVAQALQGPTSADLNPAFG